MKEKFKSCAIWFASLALGSIGTAELMIWGGRVAIVIVFALAVLVAVLLGFLCGGRNNSAAADSKEKDALIADYKERLRKESVEKSASYAKAILMERKLEKIEAERDAYRKERDEIHIREELYKKQMRKMRGRVEYWRMKYRAIVDVEADPTDEIETIPNTENE